MEAVDNGFVPATPQALPLDDEFSVPPIITGMEVSHGRFMLNYFGFGCNNTSCIIERAAP